MQRAHAQAVCFEEVPEPMKTKVGCFIFGYVLRFYRSRSRNLISDNGKNSFAHLKKD
jgi:hypothetical protein